MSIKTIKLLVAAIFLTAVINGSGQESESKPEEFGTAALGTPGVAALRAVMNLSRFAKQQGSNVHDPKRVASFEETSNYSARLADSASQSPFPASSFSALDAVDPRPPPPDTMGAVGPNHLLVMLNHGVRIQDRAGAVLSTTSLTNFWAAVGPFDPYYYSDGTPGYVYDPRVVYDSSENRWIVSAFAGGLGKQGSLLIGVSQNSDPTAAWNLYRIWVGPSKGYILDFPMTGFSKDWIVVRGFLEDGPTGGYVRSEIYVFNKANLYAGGAGLYTLFKSSDTSTVVMPAFTYDKNLSTLYLLNDTGANSLRISTITGPVGSEVWTQGAMVKTTNRWDYGAGSDFLPQLGLKQKIATFNAHISSLVYRNGSLWAVQTIYLPAGAIRRSAIQWWQITPQGVVIQRGLIDDPTSNIFYDYPSLAVNQFNDVLIGYNRFSTNQYASANYSFRAGNDPLNILRNDTVLKAGEAPYFNTRNNAHGDNSWGDYSATVVDPANDIDLWTIQEYSTTPVSGRDNWATWWGRIVPPPRLLSSDHPGSSGFAFNFFGETGRIFDIQTSTNLSAWISFTNVVGSGGIIKLQDYAATNSARKFYRAVGQ